MKNEGVLKVGFPVGSGGVKGPRMKLLFSHGVLLASISVFFFVLITRVLERRAESVIGKDAETVASVVAGSIASAVRSGDRTELEAALGGILANESILGLEITDALGEVLASSGVPTGGPESEIEVPRSAKPSGAAGIKVRKVSAPVVSRGRKVGVLRLALALSGAEEEMAAAGNDVLLASLLLFVAGFLLVLGFSSHLTAPLRQVAELAEQVSVGRSSARIKGPVGGASGLLVESFNRLVDRAEAAEKELALSRGRVEQILGNLPAEVMLFDSEGRFLYANEAAIGDRAERAWVMGKPPEEYLDHAGLAASGIGRRTLDSVRRCVSERRLLRSEQLLPGSEDESRHLVRFFSPVFDDDREVESVISYGLDISDLRSAEAELRETQERLLQAQKMESIGRLAGGVAHDFNNLLTTITGNADLLLMDMSDGDPAREDVDEIHKAAERASGLTQQLLAFSRKQVTQPKVLNLNESVAGIEKMLNRLLGEDVVLDTRLSADLGNIKADPGQIEQVIVNLAVNSRDAMPKGGRLTVRTENHTCDTAPEGRLRDSVPAGRYVMLSVMDTGIGMDEGTREKIFEPFFTKKGPGEGTGLGLATVYGIIRQAGGFIRVYSELGMGTTFKIFLPIVDAAPISVMPRSMEVPLVHGSETILLAEDQAGVRHLTKRILEKCGYNILAADGPEEALQLAKTFDRPIDLLLTDVVMPGMSGPELVQDLALVRPEIPVVYMSGYTDDQLQHHGVLDQDVVLIEKPFSAKGLAGTIRMVLNAKYEVVH